jgi:hypothetical protein
MELLGPDDVKAAISGGEGQELIVSRQMTLFATDWMSVQITPTQVTFRAKGPVSPSLRDLAQGLLASIDTVIVHAVGLNFGAHYRPDTIAELNRIGDFLAPKTVWREFFPKEHHLGLVNLQLTVQPRNEGGHPHLNGDYERLFVQPSSVVENGVYIGINNHRHIQADDKADEGGERAGTLIADSWDEAWRKAAEMFDRVIDVSLKANSQ